MMKEFHANPFLIFGFQIYGQYSYTLERSLYTVYLRSPNLGTCLKANQLELVCLQGIFEDCFVNINHAPNITEQEKGINFEHGEEQS